MAKPCESPCRVLPPWLISSTDGVFSKSLRMQSDLEGDNLDQANAAQNSANFLKEARVLGQTVPTDLSALIAENFGANATYVEGMLSRFRSNPELVDESWRAYFTELLGDGAASTAPVEQTDNGARPAASQTQTPVAEATAPARSKPAARPAAPAPQPSQTT